MFVGRVTAVKRLLVIAVDWVFLRATYACARKRRPRPVTDFDNQVISIGLERL